MCVLYIYVYGITVVVLGGGTVIILPIASYIHLTKDVRVIYIYIYRENM